MAARFLVRRALAKHGHFRQAGAALSDACGPRLPSSVLGADMETGTSFSRLLHDRTGMPRQRPIRDRGSYRQEPPKRDLPPSNPAICRDRFAHVRNEQNGAEIFIFANNYHSLKTPEKIIQLIEKVKPNIVAMELCDRRLNWLLNGGPEIEYASLKSFYYFDTRMHYLQAVLRNTFIQIDEPLSAICKATIEEAQKLGAQVAPIDMDVDTIVSMWEKALLDEDFVTLSDRLNELPNMYTDYNRIHMSIGEEKRKAYVPGEFPKMFLDVLNYTCPHFGKVTIADRNEYMIKKLKELKGPRVVALIGATHMDGILEGWKQ